ncbi:MAG: NAD(P)-dependent oxidoreductase [Deltaproteobacteria bacterium]|nr:NAD(P)-dependent oxidoreductase [Deltaproteobacteria bacterium]MBI3387769.1 NAD(P)-dependent oxidoreductase [Deltaproteobacteria bacterium]
MRDEKILITGPASQVGFPIARELVRHNDVHGLARFSNAADRARLEAIGVKCLQADLASDSFAQVPDDFTYVLNLAVMKSRDGDFASDLAANAEGTGRLMYHCRKAKAWLQCSSAGVYQHAGHRPLKETDALGDNHRVMLPTYSICKIAAETMARFSARQWNLPTTIVRLSVPYGNNGGWPAMHLDWLLAGRPIPLNPEQPNLFNPIHEDDIFAHIPKLLAIASVPATVLNWGGSDAASIEEWCGYLGQLTGHEPKFVTTDKTIGSITVDLTRMHELIGHTTVHWRDGLRRMIAARHPELTLRS